MTERPTPNEQELLCLLEVLIIEAHCERNGAVLESYERKQLDAVP